MKIGISLACFYPAHPEDTIEYAKKLGLDTVELFINTYSELSDDYLYFFKNLCDKAGLSVYSIHPFTSAIENYLFFSHYDRRIVDAKLFYEKYCMAAKILGAKVINIHGDRGIGLCDFDKYCKSLDPLFELSSKHNVTFAHENVFFNSVNHPEFIYKLREKFKGAVKFTFDIKQANKGGSDPYEVCDAMGEDIVNFHINDYDENHICLLPGCGTVDYVRIFNILKKHSYSGPALVEVYSDNYNSHSEIQDSLYFLNKINGLQF